MTAKKKNTPRTWVDSDDAPELTDAAFGHRVWQIGDKIVSSEEAQMAIKRLRAD